MTKSIALYSPKGGVGKTSLAVNLAAVSALRDGQRTLLWDLDAQGSASFLCAAEEEGPAATAIFSRQLSPLQLTMPSAYPKLDILRADRSLRSVDHLLLEAAKPKRLRKILKSLKSHYDRIILDCPPGLTELSDQIFRAVDLILVPVTPTPLGERALSQLQSSLQELSGKAPQLMPVLSMVDMRKSLHRSTVAAHPDWPVIPQSSLVEQMALKQAPLQIFSSRSRVAASFGGLWDKVDRLITTASKDVHRGRPRIPRPFGRAKFPLVSKQS